MAHIHWYPGHIAKAEKKLKELINTDGELETPWYGQLMRKTALIAYLYQIHYWYKEYNIRIEE